MEEKNNLAKLKVATQAHWQRKIIFLFLEIAWLGMLMILKFLKNQKILKSPLETFQGLKLGAWKIDSEAW